MQVSAKVINLIEVGPPILLTQKRERETDDL